jgi:hypothetical protein
MISYELSSLGESMGGLHLIPSNLHLAIAIGNFATVVTSGLAASRQEYLPSRKK